MGQGVVYNLDSTSGAKAQNVEWFSSDISPLGAGDGKASKVRVTLAVSSAVTIEVTLDSGSTWYSLNSNNALVADSVYSFDVPTLDTDNFNMRTPAAAGTTVRFCRVEGLMMEG